MVDPSKSFSAKWDAVMLLEMPKATKLLGTRIGTVNIRLDLPGGFELSNRTRFLRDMVLSSHLAFLPLK